VYRVQSSTPSPAPVAEDATRRADAPPHAALFSYIAPEERVPQEHPLRTIRPMVDAVRKDLSPPFDRLYSSTGRPSLAPEQLGRALLLPVLSTVRRERRLPEQRAYSLLFRWVVGLHMDEPLWEPAVVSKNRARLRAGAVAQAFCAQGLAQARARGGLSDDHVTGDGPVIEAWAGQKSFKPRAGAPPAPPPDAPGPPAIAFRGERRPNATPASTTAPEARLDKQAQGQEAPLTSVGHVLMEHRHGSVGDSRVRQAPGTAAREAALARAEALPGQRRVTLGADQTDAPRGFGRERRELRVAPHGAQNTSGRSSAIDRRTTRQPGDAVSQRKRECVEALCGGRNTAGLRRKTR
jgi:transposase